MTRTVIIRPNSWTKCSTTSTTQFSPTGKINNDNGVTRKKVGPRLGQRQGVGLALAVNTQESP